MLDLAGTDTERESTESSVSRGMTVTTHDCSAGESEALLWADNVDNALTFVSEAEVCEAELLDVVF